MLHSVAVLLGWLHVAFWCSVVRVIACCILLQCYWADCMFHDLCLFEIFCVPVLHSCMFVLLYRNRLLQIKVEICWESLWVVFFNPHGRSMSVAFLNLFLYADWDLSSSHPLSRPPPPPPSCTHPSRCIVKTKKKPWFYVQFRGGCGRVVKLTPLRSSSCVWHSGITVQSLLDPGSSLCFVLIIIVKYLKIANLHYKIRVRCAVQKGRV